MSPSIYSLVYPFFVCAGDEATQYGKNCSTTCHSVWTVANKSFECARCEFCFWCTTPSSLVPRPLAKYKGVFDEPPAGYEATHPHSFTRTLMSQYLLFTYLGICLPLVES